MVTQFIKDFNKMSNDLVEVFTKGYCYYFALILKSRFNGIICYLPVDNHFITYINGKYYDITGEVNIDHQVLYTWDSYQVIEPLDSERIIRDCIVK